MITHAFDSLHFVEGARWFDMKKAKKVHSNAETHNRKMKYLRNSRYSAEIRFLKRKPSVNRTVGAA